MSVIEARKGECDYEISAEKVSGYHRGILDVYKRQVQTLYGADPSGASSFYDPIAAHL